MAKFEMDIGSGLSRPSADLKAFISVVQFRRKWIIFRPFGYFSCQHVITLYYSDTFFFNAHWIFLLQYLQWPLG